ncbi:hypothetical protein HZH66_010447 [Vespula vulgaris]|uniref:Uncharacterized protein n=1 Tax=Vespula vulgaris TaxID=7454 RepID=A0A834MXV0_VESVU|nr:hypothetical protein HZH66_010447 [Vespula vulgaris]
MNNSGRPIRTPINLGPRVTHCRGLRLRVQLKEMEATEEKTRSQRDLAPLPVTLAVRLTKFDISHRLYNVYPGSFFRPGRRIPLKELLEKRACSTCTSFHRRD